MSVIQVTAESRVTHDPSSGAIRTWFDPTGEPAAKAPFTPRDLARQALQESAELFGWDSTLPDLRDHTVLDGENAYSVRFSQEFKQIPVDSSEVVVNMYADGRVHSVYNNYHYDIPEDLDPDNVALDAGQAREIVERLLRVYENHEVSEPELIVYQYQRFENHPPKPPARPTDHRENFLEEVAAHMRRDDGGDNLPREGQYFLAWDIVATTQGLRHSWRILVDAATGRLINVIDLLQYATGAGRVFDPNPIVTSGNTGLSSGTSTATLDGLTSAVVMDHLNPPDASGNLHLDGSHVQMAEIESPTFSEPVNSLGDFIFSSSDRNFLAGMCYFHIDRFQNYIRTELGMTNVAGFSIPVDPQGFGGADNSRYDPTGKNLAFGEGGIPDAADAMVTLHEYGHAIQDNVNPGFNNPISGVGEGFGDFLAAVFYDDKHAIPANTRGIMMSWDANPTDNFWPGRRYDVTYNFDDPQYTSQPDNHIRGELWCTTMFELYRELGGDSAYLGVKHAARDLIIRLHLMANFNVPTSGATAAQMGQQVEAADSNLGGWRYANGLHKKVIYDTFRRRHLSGYPDKAVDVYINDGREGGYGSPSGNDLFNENLWDENYWDTQDIWVKTSPYPNAAAQAAGGAGDHVEPPVDSTAYLYARVKNRGTNATGSGPITVRAFHCSPGIGLLWPDDWTEMDASMVAPISNVLPGPGNGVVVGPFQWTPTEVGHECVLVIVECANDRSITQDLTSADHVEHSNLVPFDNNIEQRNLVPTAAKGKMARGFYVRNPELEVRTIALHFDSSLPEGWRWRTSIVGNQVRLGPLERRWVELVIDQAGGQEVTQFDEQQTLSVTGTIDDRVIGGMTFYVAPPSAFGKPTKPEVPGVSPADLFCLNIPWQECEVEGEIEIKLRFHKK
jgi:zinc metalloprotease ZmpB